MVVCVSCGVEPSAYEQHTIPPLIESLDPERRMILSSFYGSGEAPPPLCSRCFNPAVGEVNRLFAAALASAPTPVGASTGAMESKAEAASDVDEKEKTDG